MQIQFAVRFFLMKNFLEFSVIKKLLFLEFFNGKLDSICKDSGKIIVDKFCEKDEFRSIKIW